MTIACSPQQLAEIVEQYRAEHPLITFALEARCRRALDLPELGTLGPVATAAVQRRLVDAIREYEQSRGRR